MGSPLSPIIADIVLQDLENNIIDSLNFKPTFYFRYVDDIVLTAPNKQFNTILSSFNSYHPRLQFTLETSNNNKLNFLDLTLIKKDNRIIHDWFHKPTFSGRYLNYYSNHPISQKKGIVMGLIDRAFFLSHPTFHKKNLNLAIQILINNNYPIHFIFKTLRLRLKHNFIKNNDPKKFLISRALDNQHNTYITLPYLNKISENVGSIIRSKVVGSSIAYKSPNKLTKFIRTQKDELGEQIPNVVYKISCKDCDASYVGQTSRSLCTRVKEHQNHINRNTTQKSVITEHRINYQHNFNWDNVSVLDVEKSYHKRLISESIHIKKQINGINLQNDTECLDNAYLPLIDIVEATDN